MAKVKEDKYFGIFTDNKLIGFFMLRGFDDGYNIPSYGVWIAPDYTGLGLAKLTLAFAISFCKLNKIKKIMLKVHPENVVAKRLYESMGFVNTGIDQRNDNLIYQKDLNIN